MNALIENVFNICILVRSVSVRGIQNIFAEVFLEQPKFQNSRDLLHSFSSCFVLLLFCVVVDRFYHQLVITEKKRVEKW